MRHIKAIDAEALLAARASQAYFPPVIVHFMTVLE